MARADTGCRPLITMTIKRFISYFKSLQNRKSNLCYDAFVFETENTISPNFCKFAENFNLDIKELTSQSEEKVHKICTGSYDRFWKTTISESGKASSFNKFKTNIALEPHLDLHLNLKYKIAISHFRLSNHTLMIEKGRHKPIKIDKKERKCYFCKNKIENEEHFLIECALYTPFRRVLENIAESKRPSYIVWQEFEVSVNEILETQSFNNVELLLPSEKGRVTRSGSMFGYDKAAYKLLVDNKFLLYGTYLGGLATHFVSRFHPWPKWLVERHLTLTTGF